MPPCQATRVAARERRMAPFGAISPPHAKAGATWVVNKARVNITGTNNLSILGIVKSPFLFLPLWEFIHYDGAPLKKVPLFRVQMEMVKSWNVLIRSSAFQYSILFTLSKQRR